MGVFQKLGIRNLAIYNADLITWIRHYGLAVGGLFFKALLRPKNGYFTIRTPYFKNPVYLRNNFSDQAIFKQVFYERQYYFDDLQKLDACYIIDAGANIGLASLYFANTFPDAQIVAIEPEHANFELLKRNTSSYKNIFPAEEALWYTEENIAIENPNSLAASFQVTTNKMATIKGTTIPQLLERLNWPGIDILKMDIEGAEKEIFSQNVDWLRQVKLLIIELHDNYKPGSTKTFFKALENCTYEARFHNENIFIFFN